MADMSPYLYCVAGVKKGEDSCMHEFFMHSLSEEI